jgi:hypothetical protein
MRTQPWDFEYRDERLSEREWLWRAAVETVAADVYRAGIKNVLVCSPQPQRPFHNSPLPFPPVRDPPGQCLQNAST